MTEVCELCEGYLARAELHSLSDVDQRRLFRLWLDRFVGQEIVLREDDDIEGYSRHVRTGVLSSVHEGPELQPYTDAGDTRTTLALRLGGGGLINLSAVWADGQSWYTGSPMYAIGPKGCDPDDCEDYAEWLWNEAKVYNGPPYCVNCHKYAWEKEPVVEILR